MADNVTISLNVSTEKAVNSLKDFKGQMRELKGLQIQYNEAVASGDVKLQASLKNQMTAMVQLKNDMMDTQKAMKYLDPGELLGGWVKMTQGLVGSFAAVTGAMSLFGGESEEIQRIEKKSMVLIQTMMGLEQMRALLDKRDGQARLKGLIENTAAQYKEVAAMLTKNIVIQTTSKSSKLAAAAQWVWNAAVMAFPLVALVAGVAALSYGIYKLIDAQKEQMSVLSVSQDLQKKQGENAAAELVQLDAMVKKLKDAKDNKKEYSAVVKQWNEKYGKEYNASLSTTVFNLDAITNAANKAREAILKKALAAAAEEKLKEIVGDNITMYETYITATESLQLKKAALAKEEEMLQYFLKEGMDEAAAAQYMYIKSLKDKIAVGYEAYGLDEDYVKEIEVLTQVVADNTLTTQSQTTATKDYNVAVKDTTKDLEKLNKLLAEGVDIQDELELQLSDEAKAARKAAADKLKAQQEAADNELSQIEFTREREEKIKDGWYADEILKREDNFGKRLKMLKEFHEKGLITEKDYQKVSIDLIKEQVDKYGEYISSIGSNLSTVFSNLTEMAMIEIDKIDYAYNQRYETASGTLDKELKKASEVWGEESKQYKALVEQKTKLDDDKATHDKKMEADKKAAQNKYAKTQLAIQMAMTTADTAKGIAGIWATELETKGALGAPFAIAMTAILSGVYATQMALMSKQMGAIGKMRRGGFIDGPSHEQGGVLRELEGGEAVINATSMRLPGVRNIASRLNELGGGTSFRDSRSNGVLTVDSQSVANAVIEAIRVIPVAVSENEITQTQKRVQVIKNKTSF